MDQMQENAPIDQTGIVVRIGNPIGMLGKVLPGVGISW